MSYGYQPPPAGGYGPPPGGFGPPGGGHAPGYGPPPAYGPPGGAPGGAPPGPDVVAIVALVLGILSIPMHFCCYLGWPLGFIAIICAIISLVRISGSNGKLTGKGLAIGGIVAAILGFLMMLGIFLLYGAAVIFSTL